MSDAGISHREMLRWGLTIADAAEIPAVANATLQRAHEAALAQKNEEIVQLRDQVSDLAARLADLELESPSAEIGTSTAPASATTRPAAAACRRATAKSLSAVWFDWHIGQPWSTSKKRDRKRYHDAKLTVAYMKLFLPAGFQLGEAGTNAKAGVVKTGVAAESGILQYLRALGLNNSAYGTVIKALKKHHKEGKLDSRIEHYRKLLQSGRAVDLTPPHARPELMPVAKDKQAEQTLRAED
ncbi:hypothetical protein BBJ28_00023393 [Nothophytophthora sp. Chile5]|nr:hypothetical protein BBJ28_00023393 [Nothophytophthora sp. Chile5]